MQKIVYDIISLVEKGIHTHTHTMLGMYSASEMIHKKCTSGYLWGIELQLKN